jgi:uncharacterized protein YndB with AHSA1/START domain
VTDPVLIVVKRRFAASPERVFDAWIEPAAARKWLFATENGEIVRCEIDPRVGGTFTVTDHRDGEDIEHTGKYIEIDRPCRLVFTFGVPKYSNEPAVVTIDIRALPDGGCELTLMQEMPPAFAAYKERTEQGWTKMLGKLDELLA